MSTHNKTRDLQLFSISVPVSTTMSSPLLIFMFIFAIADNAPTNWHKNIICAQVPKMVLENVLGGAFNSRYMCIEPPIAVPETSTGKKRGAWFEEDFFVDGTLMEEVGDDAAWNVNHIEISKMKYGIHRDKRGVDYMQQWQCKMKIEWMDLSSDYFPKYLRTVQCSSENCWFGLYKCTPRYFAVKLQRRKRGLCQSVKKWDFLAYRTS